VVPKAERAERDVLMDKHAATRLLRSPGLFEEDNVSAEIYLHELDFHNQLKARLLEHRAAVQVVRETTLAPDDFKKRNGQPLRGLQDPATLAWNISTTCFFKAGYRPWKLASARPGVCYVGIVYKDDASTFEAGQACVGAQMFLDSGDGVVFRGAVGPWKTETKGDYRLPKEKAAALMQLVVSAYLKEHGEAPRELFVHGKTRFSEEEWGVIVLFVQIGARRNKKAISDNHLRGAVSWLANSSQAFDLHGLFDNNRVNLHDKYDYPQQRSRIFLRQAARLDRSGDLAGELGLALHLGRVGVAQVGIDIGAAFFGGDACGFTHLRAPCCACQASKSCFGLQAGGDQSGFGVAMPLWDFF
jgi:hypothetical protein